MEITELYKIVLTVLSMDAADTARSGTSGKLDEQAPLAFSFCIKLICSKEDSQPLMPAREPFPATHLPPRAPLSLFSLFPWGLQQKPWEIKQVRV